MDKIERLRFAINQARENVKSAQSKLNNLLDECNHIVVKFHESARCDVCGEDFGWYCPDSADHRCDYTKFGNDQCDYCGEPRERK